MSNFKTVKTAAFTSALFAGVMLAASAATVTSANAMVIHNCTDFSMRVKLEPSNGANPVSARIEPQAGRPISTPTSQGKYRIYVGNGAGNYFSGRNGDGTYSIGQDSAGNFTINTGNRCPKPEPRPMPTPRPIPIDGGTIGGGTGGLICAINKFGQQLCIRTR